MEAVAKFIILIGVIILLAFIMALPTMLLWNWLMPDIFGLTTISFLQALGLNFLTGIFFRSTTSNSK